MPTATQFKESQLITLLLSGLAGGGKSTLAYSAPGPIAALLVDKPIVADLPAATQGYDPSNIYYKPYPPPNKNLKETKAVGNVADEVLDDITAIKNAFYLGKTEVDILVRGVKETWPMPRTIILEGGDFLEQHILQRVLAMHKKDDPSDFDDRFQPWRLRRNVLLDIYNVLTSLPSLRYCNIVVTTGLSEDQEMKTNERGRKELMKTGFTDPALGGAMDTEGPRKFANSFLCLAEAGRWWVVTKPSGKYAKYRGVRSGGFGLADVVDVTIDPKKPENIWNKLFSA